MGKGSALKNVDGVVDPQGTTLKEMNKQADEAPGGVRLFLGSDAIIRAYPEFAQMLAPSADSMLLELTRYDIASDDLKQEHKPA